MSLDGERVELAEYARILVKRKWMVLIPTILVVASAMFALRYMTPIYVSSALIRIVDRDVVEVQADVITGGRGRTGNRPRDYERMKIMQLTQEVKGQKFLEPVGQQLGLDVRPSVRLAAEKRQAQLPDLSLDEIIVRTYTKRLREKISVLPAGISQYRFVCEDEDPYVAYQLAKAVSEEYVNYTLASGTEVTDRATVFTGEQLARHREMLEEAEGKLHSYRSRITNRNLRQDNPVNAANFADAKRLIDEASLEVNRVEHRIERGLERVPPRLGSVTQLEDQIYSTRMRRLASDLQTAERDQVTLMIQGAEGLGGADVSRIRQDIFNEMRDQVVDAYPDQPTSVQNQIGDVIFDRLVVRSVEARRSEIQRLVNRYSNRVVEQPKEDLELERRAADVQRLRDRVGLMEQNLATADVKRQAQEEAVHSRVKIVDHPEVPIKPDRPNKLRVLLLALAVGPLLGIGAVVLAEYMDTSLRTIEDVEEVLGLPVLGTIPRLVPSTTRAPSKRRRKGKGDGSRRRSVGAAGLTLALSTMGMGQATLTASDASLDLDQAGSTPPHVTGEING